MSISAEASWILSQKYTQDTAQEMGALKGASCQIKSMTKRDGVNTIVFQWVDKSDVVHESTMTVNDGTPIYAWTSGDSYKVGDLVIYQSAFYQCVNANSDVTFNSSNWSGIGNAESKYDIVQNSSLLPLGLTVFDRKMYYCIEDSAFYLWNGFEWAMQNFKSTYAVTNENLIIQ